MLKVSLKSVSAVADNKEKEILHNISFELHKNSIYSIIGKNGEGKTTLLYVISKLLDTAYWKYDGIVEFEGQNILTLPQDKLREIREFKIQYVLQDAAGSFDPLKKIGFYFKNKSYSEKEIETLFNFFNLPSFQKIFKLHSYELSGGMAQRVSIILALLQNPALLILDEPTSGIDEETILLIKQAVSEFIKKGDKTVLIITQDISFVKGLTDQIAFLSNGTLSEFSSFHNFVNGNTNPVQLSFINAYKLLKHD